MLRKPYFNQKTLVERILRTHTNLITLFIYLKMATQLGNKVVDHELNFSTEVAI
jgi:hypothetical protein